VKSFTDVTVTIQWMDPPLYGSMITEYLIIAISMDHSRTVNYKEDDNVATIDTIIPNTIYNISVSAVYKNVFTSSPVNVSVTLRKCEGSYICTV